MLPSASKVALPPKFSTTVLATLPSLALVAYNWLPLMASVEVAEISPAATFITRRSRPAEPTDTAPAAVLPAKLP